MQNPDYFFGRSPEHGYINPDNLFILLNHLKCAAFELPLGENERFGALDLKTLCRHLEELGFLHHAGDAWHWTSESYPADAISLRSVSSDNFVIVDTTEERRVIGEVDFTSALTTVHEKAIYMQDGQQYQVEKLDYENRKAYVTSCAADYFTDAIDYTRIKILETFESETAGPARKSHGEVQVNGQIVGFKKIKFHTMENVGAGELALPEQEMHTTAWWLTLPREFLEEFPYDRTERLYGVNGLGNALHAIATLLVMCDARDLGVAVGENAVNEELALEAPVQPAARRRAARTQIFEPNLYLYDKYPGGVGLSEPLFRLTAELLHNTRRLIANCPCASGCPSCVGPAGEIGEKGKEVALAILEKLSVVGGP